MTELYFWLFRRLANNPNQPLTLWLWRRVVIAQSIAKHLRRGNWKQALPYLRMF